MRLFHLLWLFILWLKMEKSLQRAEIICEREDIQHANVVNPKWRYKNNEQADYECEEGYKGSPTRTCGEHGWTGDSQCTEITCDRLNIPNANIVNPKWTYKHNERADYECEEGYKGRPTRTCGENGWTGDSQCTEILCKKPDIQDAGITHNEKESYKHNDRVQLECKIGENKRFTVTCKKGNWTEIQSCAACPKPDVPNGFVKLRKNNYALYYTCNPGYKLSTSGWWGEAECLDTKWSGLESVQCIEETKCGDIPAIPHAEMKPQQRAYEENESIPLICEAGYQAQDYLLICQEGMWTLNGISLETATLQRVCTPSDNNCGHPPKFENAVVETSYQQKFLSGSEVTYQCHAEYTMDEGNTGTLQCVNGEWENKSITCTYITCQVEEMHSQLSVAGLSSVNKTVKSGHTIQFQCNRPYILDGSEAIECLQSGEWSAPFPTCTENCKVTGVPNNIHITPNVQNNQVRRGQKLRFTCRYRGDFLRGNAVVECLADGQWSAPFPTCGGPLGCSNPPPLTDGDTKESLKDHYSHNERVEYLCQNLYQMEGQPYQTCMNGKWVGQMRCLRPCTVDADAMSIRNIAFKYRHDDKLYAPHNDVIEFRCVSGRPDGTLSMRGRCIDGAMPLPTCN